MQLSTWRKNDLPNLAEIAAKAMPFSWPLKVFQDCLAANYVGWVLKENNKIIGFVIIFVQTEICEIINIAILPSHQHQGFGRRLIETVLNYSQAMQINQITLEARRSNTKAIKFYKHFGFREVGVRKDYYPLETGREDGLILTRNLSGTQVAGV